MYTEPLKEIIFRIVNKMYNDQYNITFILAFDGPYKKMTI